MELKRELGINNSIKLASNENPWGPSPKVVRSLRLELTNQHRYPDGSGYQLRQVLAKKVNLSVDEIVLGNGSGEIFELLINIFVRERDEVISSRPSFPLYQQFVQAQGGDNFVIPLKKNHHDLESILLCVTEKTKLIILDNPNNPTGCAINPGELYTFLSKVPESVIVVLDEAYVDYMEDEFQVDVFSLIRNTTGRCGVVVVRTFSKAYGLAGLRVGYGLMPVEIADSLHRVRQPFNVNQMAQAGALAALGDDEYYNNILKMTREGREYLMAEVEKIGCRVHPSQANFFLIDVQGDAEKLYEVLLQRGVIVRPVKHLGLPKSLRISVGTENENQRFLDEFYRCIQTLGYV